MRQPSSCTQGCAIVHLEESAQSPWKQLLPHWQRKAYQILLGVKQWILQGHTPERCSSNHVTDGYPAQDIYLIQSLWQYLL